MKKPDELKRINGGDDEVVNGQQSDIPPVASEEAPGASDRAE